MRSEAALDILYAGWSEIIVVEDSAYLRAQEGVSLRRIRPKVLLIEDDAEDAELIQNMLSEDEGRPFDIEWVDRLAAGLARLDEGGIDVVLLDLSLPDSQGLVTFNKVHAKWFTMPVVVLTGLDNQEVALKAVGSGAQDYLVKGEVKGRSLVRSLHYAIERGRVGRGRGR